MPDVHDQEHGLEDLTLHQGDPHWFDWVSWASTTALSLGIGWLAWRTWRDSEPHVAIRSYGGSVPRVGFVHAVIENLGGSAVALRYVEVEVRERKSTGIWNVRPKLRDRMGPPRHKGRAELYLPRNVGSLQVVSNDVHQFTPIAELVIPAHGLVDVYFEPPAASWPDICWIILRPVIARGHADRNWIRHQRSAGLTISN